MVFLVIIDIYIRMKGLIKQLLIEGLNEKFNIIQNTLNITEPYDGIQKFNINGKNVYALFGNVDYYKNKESILAIKRKSQELKLDHNNYANFISEFSKRFNSIPELKESTIIASIDSTTPVTDEMASSIGKPYEKNGFKKIDDTFKMRSIPIDKRGEISNIFNMNFNINNDTICILDDFITTGSSFKNAFNIIPNNINSVGVCLFKLES